jgi:hypothetical protein
MGHFAILHTMTFGIFIIVLQRLGSCLVLPYHHSITKPRSFPESENRNERDKGV